jgi:hypothetical protein
MDLFEQLFAKAEIHGLIEQNIVSDKLSIQDKRQSLNSMREYDITQYCIEFRTYLNEKNNISFVADNDFSQYCHKESTFETFVEFIHYRKAETKKNIAQHAKKNAETQRCNEQQLIAMEILGLTTGENNFNPVKPNFKHIPDVLSKHNLSIKEAIFYLRTYTGGLLPIVDTNLKPKVIEYLQSLIDLDYKFEPEQNETKTEQETENDFTLSTIEDWLFEFKEKMNETDYKNLVSALMQYFENGTFPKFSKPIQINGRINIKLFGWALNRIFEAKGKGVELELLKFAKQNISLFTDVPFNESNVLKSLLYKYFTTKTE